jgi:ferritin-like metal-binding protein YciE
LLEEAEGLIEDTQAATEIRDCRLIIAAQKVEHYEIATYGGLKSLAGKLGNSEVQGLLNQILQN